MITDIRLQHFRSYTDSSFEISPGVNIVVGPNASGKTNLLEAVMVVATGSSYRASDYDLVQFEAPWARVDAHTQHGQRSVLLELSDSHAHKRYIVDDQKLSRLTRPKLLPLVLFEPNHLMLFHGAPELRRVYLDELLGQLIPGYKQLHQHYRRALSQRNALLKTGFALAQPQLFAWNLRLSELGEQLVRHRLKLVDDMNQRLSEVYSELARTKTTVTATYHTSLPTANYASHLLKKLEAHNELDCQRGFTTTGPHRDDLLVQIGQQSANLASRGEMRSLVLVLKIVELSLVQQAFNQPPLLLLDDVFSELDGARRQALTEHLQAYQTFITTTDADVVIQHFSGRCNVIPTTKG